MADSNTPIWVLQLNERLEELRLKLNEPIVPLTNDAILQLAVELQPLYRKLLLYDLNGGIHRHLENWMWNDCFKTPLTRFGRTDRALFNFMIESGVGFYLSLIQDVGLRFDIPFISSAARNLYCTTPSLKSFVRNVPSKSSVYYIIQNCLLHVGDLLRYRGSLAEALKMYEKSAAVCPSNGHPWAQMSVTQFLINNKSVESVFAACYYNVRAICVAKPHSPAVDALHSIISKIKHLQTGDKLDDFLCQFIVCAGCPHSSQVQPSSFVALISPLITNGKISSTLLTKIIVVALWAWKRESGRTLLAVDNSFEGYTLEIVAALLNALLIAVIGISDPTEFHALAHLKILLDWLHCNSSVMSNSLFRSKLHVSTLCKFFNQLKTIQNNMVLNLDDFSSFILPEEKKLLGFVPLSQCYENLHDVIEDSDKRCQTLRIHRILKCADSMCHSRMNFIQFNSLEGIYMEVQPPTPKSLPSTLFKSAPSSRNVALQSIFQQRASPMEGTSPASGFPSPFCWTETTKQPISSTASSPGSSFFEPIKPEASHSESGFPSESQSDNSPCSSSNLNTLSPDSQQLFRSIWTPLESDMESKPGNGWD